MEILTYWGTLTGQQEASNNPTGFQLNLHLQSARNYHYKKRNIPEEHTSHKLWKL